MKSISFISMVCCTLLSAFVFADANVVPKPEENTTGEITSDKLSMAGWIAYMENNRPRLPSKETRSDPAPEATVKLANINAKNEVTEIAKAALHGCFPTDATWTTLLDSEEESLLLAEFSDSHGGLNRFAVYGQRGVLVPYFWVTQGLESIESEDPIAFLKTRCFVGASSEIAISKDVLTADNIRILERGKDIVAPYDRFHFAVIDDKPGANWAHPCRYVFIPEDQSGFTVLFCNYYPLVLLRKTGEEIQLRQAEVTTCNPMVSLADIQENVYGYAREMEERNAISYTRGDAGKSYFVLICGGQMPRQNGIRFWSDTAMLYSTLTKKYGVPKGNIRVYMSDGTSSEKDANLASTNSGITPVLVDSPKDLDGDGEDDITGAATKSNLSSAFSTLRSLLSPSDQLFVFITSHGGPDGVGGVGNRDCIACLFDEYGETEFRDDELADWTKGFSCPVGFAVETCYSGGFIDDICETTNRAIATACNHYENSAGYSGGGAWVGGTVGKTTGRNGWIFPFIAAWRGCYSMPWSSSGGYPWEDSSISANADANGDGLVSFDEATNFALANDPYAIAGSEHPQSQSTSGTGASFFVLKQSGSTPSLPTIPIAPSPSVSGTTLSWSAVSGANYYRVYRATNPYADPEPYGDWQTGTTKTIVKPSSEGTAYFWFVKAASSLDEKTASPFSATKVVTGDSSYTLLPYSSAHTHTTYDDKTEFHLYPIAAINATPYSGSLWLTSSVRFTKSSGSGITATINGTDVASSPTIGSGSGSSFSMVSATFAISATANSSTTPRSCLFHSNATAPSGYSSSDGQAFGKHYGEWYGRPHYIYQAGKFAFDLSTTSQTASSSGGTYSTTVTATPSPIVWTASADKDWVHLYRSSSNGSGVLGYVVDANTGSARTATITFQSGGTTYKTLTITQSAGTSVILPTAPTVSVTTYGSAANASSITVTWSGGSGATSYNLYRSTTTSRPSSAYKTNVTSPYVDSDSSLIPGVKYYYWVEAKNSAGSAFSGSDWGNRAVTLSLGSTSTSATSAGGAKSVSVTANTSWSAAKDATWITFTTSSGNGNGTCAFTVAPNTSTSSRTGRVVVTAGSGTDYPKAVTNTVTQAGAPLALPTAPTIDISTYGNSANASAITVTWSGGSGATSYNLYRSTTTSRPSSAYKTNVTSPYVDSDSSLIPGVKYYYWVEAKNSAGSAFSGSDWGNRAVTLSLGSTSTSATSAGGAKSVSVTANTSWSAAKDATWITFTTSSGNGNGTCAFTVAPNTSTSSRTGRVVVTAGNGTDYPKAVTNTVTQAGSPTPVPDSDLAEGMNATNLVFTSGGNAEWIAVLSPAHDGALAVQSGDIGSSQSSWMQTTVVGPALVSFWWNVSSETSYDKLTFAVDGATKGTISGTGGTWRKRKALLGPGTHTLRWTYAKDSSDDAGSDCGWVDQLSIQPWPERAGYHTSPSLFVGTLDSPLDHGDYFAPNGESGFSWDQLDSGRWVAYVFGSGDPSVLQTVLDQAEEGDIVAVWPGCYDPITVAVDNVSIVAIGSREETFINARYADRCATFDNAPNSYLDGFTLVQGYAEDGGGISGGKAWDCLVAGCEAIGDGGGAYRTTLTDCRLLANVAGHHGGGAYGCSLNRCELRGNEAGVWGGGIDNCSATGCLVAHNSAYKGGGADESTLMNCTVADNEADASFGGVWYCTVRNSIVSGNTAPFAANWGDDQNHTTFSYSCTYPVPPGAGNFNVNPNFVDRASGNYHLSNYSRCRDKGNRNLTKAPYDLAGLDRVMGANIDVGCYEYATQVTPLDPADYDGDGVPDIGFYNPATGTWFLRKTSDGEVRREKLGFSGITVVPRDYDGDGVRDPAIYNPASGYWQILQSTTGAVAVKKLGWKGITLVDAADCDGDGKADPIICNPASKTWQVLRSSDGGTTVVPNFGWAGIKPACGDYDGDGRAELAFYSPTSCTWYVRWRDGTQTSLKLGVAGARVFPLDADFDGALDPCYFNPSTGKWTWKSLGTGAGETVKFGDSTVTPHPFDWDGDGVPDTFGFYSPYRAGFLDLYLAPDGTRSAYMVNF